MLRRPKFVLSSPKPADDVDDNDTWQSSGGARREAADPPYEVHIIPPVKAGAKKRDSDIGDSKLIRRYESPYEDRLSFDYKIVTRRTKGQKAPLDWFGCKGYNALKCKNRASLEWTQKSDSQQLADTATRWET